jgi:type II secretory pathway component GspD/PulD (secretin)
MIRGGFGGGSSSSRGGSSSRRGGTDTVKMSVSADPRTNSLIVSAPNQLFEEVKLLVETLDQATADNNSAMKVVALKRSSGSTVQKALTSIAGENVRSSSSSSGRSDSGSSGSSSSSGWRGGDSSDWMRRIQEYNSSRGGFGGGPSFFGGFGSRDGSSSSGYRPFGSYGGSSGYSGSRYSGSSGSSSSRYGGSSSSRDSGSSRGRD